MKIGTPTSATTPSDSIDGLKAGYGNNPNSGCGCIDGGRYRTIQRDGVFQKICARLSRDHLQTRKLFLRRTVPPQSFGLPLHGEILYIETNLEN